MTSDTNSFTATFAFTLIVGFVFPNELYAQNLYVRPEVQKRLRLHYMQFQENLEVELCFCAFGDINADVVRIKRIKLPPVRYVKNLVGTDKTGLGTPHTEFCRGFIALGHSHERKPHLTLFDKRALTQSRQSFTLLLVPEDGGLYLHLYSKTQMVNPLDKLLLRAHFR